MSYASRSKLASFLLIAGPGLVVMLADTDAGSIITAAQSGAVWGYKLLLLQFILMPILYIAQELTVRLGIVTRMGHGELIKKHFGKVCAWISISTLLITCIGAIISEFSGIAGVGLLFGVPSWISVVLAASFLAFIVLTGTYRSVERVAICLGLFELIFFFVAYKAHPNLHEMLAGLAHMPITNPDYLYLTAANIGAVIMPWMIFYQQSAVIDKGLTIEHLKATRLDTAIGAVIAQLVMAAILVSTAATIGKSNPGVSLNTVHQISEALTPFIGEIGGKVCFAMGMLGASLVAAIVVSLTAAWGLGEVTGYKRSLTHHPKHAPWFYIVYLIVLICGVGFVLSGINLVKLNVGIEVMNAVLLPIVLGFLFLLAYKVLPQQYRLKGPYACFVFIILLITSLFGLIGGLWN